MAEQAKSARPYRIAHCFVGRIGSPHRRQFAGSMQFGQHRRVADERRRDHNAGMFETRKLPVKTIAARPRLIATVPPWQAFVQLGDLISAVRKCSQAAYLATTQSFRDGHRHRRLMHIQTHEKAISVSGVMNCQRGRVQNKLTLSSD